MPDATVIDTEYGPLLQLPEVGDLQGLEEVIRQKRLRAQRLAATPTPEFRAYGGGIYQLPGWGDIASHAVRQGFAPTIASEADDLQRLLNQRLQQQDAQQQQFATKFVQNLPQFQAMSNQLDFGPPAPDQQVPPFAGAALSNPYTRDLTRDYIKDAFSQWEEAQGKLPTGYRRTATGAERIQGLPAEETTPYGKPRLPEGWQWNPLTGKAEVIPGVDLTPKPPTDFEWVPGREGKEARPIIGGPKDPNAPQLPTTESRNRQAALVPILTQADQFETALDDWVADPANLEKRAAAQGAHTALVMQVKNLEGLGAPQKADLELLVKEIGDPFSLKGTLEGAASKVQGGSLTGPTKQRLNQLRLRVKGMGAPSGATGTWAAPTAANRGAGDGSKADPFKVNSPREASMLPKDSYFITPDGRVFQRN